MDLVLPKAIRDFRKTFQRTWKNAFTFSQGKLMGMVSNNQKHPHVRSNVPLASLYALFGTEQIIPFPDARYQIQRQ